MYQLGDEPQYNARNVARARGSAWQVYKRLLGYAWRYKTRLVLSLVFALVVAVSFGAMIVSIGKVVTIVFEDDATAQEQLTKDVEALDKAAARLAGAIGWAPRGLGVKYRSLVEKMQADQMRALIVASGVLLSLTVLAGLARFLQEYFAGAIGASISVKLGEDMFENVVRLSMRFYERQTTGEMIARFTNDIFMINRGLAGVFVKLLREPFKAFVFLAIALRTDVGLTLFGLCVLPPVGYVIVRIGKKVRKSVRRSLERIASMATVANETFTGITIVKGFCMEAYETARLKVEMKKLRRYLLQMVKADAAIGPTTEVILVVGFLGFVLLSGHKVIAGNLDGGNLVALYLALLGMLDPVRKLSTVNNQIQTSVASAERVFEFIDKGPEIIEAADAVALAPLQHSLRFEDVHFSYDGETEVLRNTDFEIKKGEMVAFVGFSGVGKSTVAKLIPRFYDVSAGQVTIDGVDVRKATLASLRGQIGIVTQETILFNQTVRENITFGRQTYSEEHIRRAAEMAHAADFIGAMSQGYDTVIGEAGVALSGGQRQRLAIARALIKDPAILILDEATSSLDSESEQAIQKAIEEFVVGRTTIVIAHRLSTIQRADRILVLDNGCIAEQGTHHELLAQDGLYRRLYETQFASALTKSPT